jgi:transposase-like protein
MGAVAYSLVKLLGKAQESGTKARRPILQGDKFVSHSKRGMYLYFHDTQTRWAKNSEFRRLFKSKVMNMGFNLESHTQ